MITAGQQATTAASWSFLCAVPPGACSVTLSGAGAAATISPAPGGGGTGYVLQPAAAPTSFCTFPSSDGATLMFASAAPGTQATVSYLISTED